MYNEIYVLKFFSITLKYDTHMKIIKMKILQLNVLIKWSFLIFLCQIVESEGTLTSNYKVLASKMALLQLQITEKIKTHASFIQFIVYFLWNRIFFLTLSRDLNYQQSTVLE